MSPINLADLYIALGVRHGDRLALQSDKRRYSFSELAERGAQAARALQAEEVEPGERIGIAVADGADAVVLILGAWMVNACVVMLDFRSRAEERERICRSLSIGRVLEERRPPGQGNYLSLLCDEDWWDSVASLDPSPLNLEPLGHTAAISLTSGTTGEPQGIGFTHERALLRMKLQAEPGVHTVMGHYVNPSPLVFSAWRNHTLGNLLLGTSVTFVSPLISGPELLARLEETQASFTMIMPTQIRALLDQPGDTRKALRKLEVLFTGGTSVHPEMIQEARARLCEGFAVSYSAGITGQVAILHGPDLLRRPDTVGRPLSNVRVRILDEEGRDCAPGTPGLIHVASSGIASFVEGPENSGNSDRLERGWAIPGDIGFLDEEGYLTISGRAKEVIIRGGGNVYPSEIEAVIESHSKVAESAVVGIPSETHGEEIAAFIVAAEPMTEAEIQGFCRARLGPDKRPRVFRFLEALPRNTNGKVLRRKLSETFRQ
jgi:acyl-CoA synthetase (AMP-forming)/AMP-acid ligase II